MNIVAFIVGLVIGICIASSCWKKAVHKTIVDIKDEQCDQRLRQLAQMKIDLERQRKELQELDAKQIGSDIWHKRLRQIAQTEIDLDRQRKELEDLDKKQIGKK